MGYVPEDVVTNDAVQIIPDATLCHFGILESNVHMAPACKKVQASRLCSRMEQTAILSTRALYPDSSLADLYDELTMPVELRKAHQDNDRAVMQAYSFDIKTMTESLCVAELFRMYQQLAIDSAL